ncbi:Phophatidylserine decarboxylase-domain-containing protein [Aspergillus caelatus]|uniref:Phophatidylserine decarboxylase-domain-containing protein n=1 Tax=Aspergillus caelatus TaxID=61420 RepID=A0A5N6ZX73_9EURO|nr:Phophatidylserine decarboxylase-domain-containing protein [Aspergillus caelatus]KAE8361519.1 Phophatidylserine decarboxylase-domain-containing protein [Aspergillus caelatus]
MQSVRIIPTYIQRDPGAPATGSSLHGHGHWMPENVKLRRAWLSSLLDKTKAEIPRKLRNDEVNPVETFRKLIENNSSLYMLAHSMFEEIPEKAPYDRDPTTLRKQVRNYKTMLYLFNTLLTEVPEYFLRKDPNVPSGLIGFPFNIIVDWPMGTPSGRQFFLDTRVNECLKNILNKWNEFLKDPTAGGKGDKGGNQALIDAGWSSAQAVKQLEDKANEATPKEDPKKFSEIFQHPSGGTPTNFFNYACWDEFFTRKFKDGVRPVAKAAVVNACESFPLSFDTDVSRRNTFWLKGTPYSLHDMLGATQDDKAASYVDSFVGGSVYQAFLSADSYHCWNAPVTGEVKYRSLIDGTYFAETAAAGFGGSNGPDPAGPDVSQRYITHIAARGVLVVDTNVNGGANIGLVGFVPVGMSEVSTCDWFDNTAVGKTIKQGDVIGAFHSGGSTHCLIFQREAVKKLEFIPKAQYPEIATTNLAVNSELAKLVS